jgi:lipopolysaccharide transport system permease protein
VTHSREIDRAHRLSPLVLVESVWRHRATIGSLAIREVQSKYKGSVLGVLWSLVNPLFMLAIYTFVFSEVFRMRWGGGLDHPLDFALMLFAGMVVFGFISEVLTRAPTLVTANPNLVKKILFPLEISAPVAMISATFQFGIGLVLLLSAYTVSKGVPPPTALLFPLIALPLFLLALGMAWFISSLGVFIRDISQLIGHILMVAMFLSPIFYPITAIPERFRPFFYLNPLTFLVEQARKVLILGELPDWTHLALFTGFAVIVCYLGFAWFQFTRKGFADVL